MKKVLFIRHGATAGNLEKRYIGRTDEPLCAQGKAQVNRLALLGLRADVLFVSPARRTRETAAVLFPQLQARVIPDFWETDFGAFEGKTAEELSGDPAYRAWLDTGCQGPIPGGETVEGFKARCRAAFTQAMETVPQGGTAAFVLHGGVIMAISEAFVHPVGSFYSYHLEPGSFTFWCFQEGRLESLLSLQA